MAKKTYEQKDGTVWEWNETPELKKLLKNIKSDSKNGK